MRQIAAIAEGSRYHGYSDASAPPFLRYEIAKVVDLTDATAAPRLAQPVEHAAADRAHRRVRSARAVLVAVRRSLRLSRSERRRRASLSLCELFEQGVVNEVWIQDGEAGVRRAPLSLERKQSYDGTETAVAGSFAPDAGGGGCLDDIICGVTVRLAHLDAARGPGCDLEVRGWEHRSDVGSAAGRCAPTRWRS